MSIIKFVISEINSFLCKNEMPLLNSAFCMYFARDLCEHQVLRSVEYENVYS
jgi:hypothetical protein